MCTLSNLLLKLPHYGALNVCLNFSLHTPARPGFIPLFVFRLKKVSLRFRKIFQDFDFFRG